MGAAEQVRALVQPVIEQNGAELYDIEYESGVLRVAVDKPGGIDVDTIGELSRLISDALDREDPIPDQRYLLEVSSPGIERKLRTPEHFRAQLGNAISVKCRQPLETADGTSTRRAQGLLRSVDDNGIEVELDAITVRLSYDDIESARSVYDWDQQSSPSDKKKKAAAR